MSRLGISHEYDDMDEAQSGSIHCAGIEFTPIVMGARAQRHHGRFSPSSSLEPTMRIDDQALTIQSLPLRRNIVSLRRSETSLRWFKHV